MLGYLHKLSSLFSAQERRRLGVLMVAIAAVACLEIAGIASILPFMAVVANPDAVNSNPYLNHAYTVLGFQSPHRFLVFTGVAMLGWLILNNTCAALTTWRLLAFTNEVGTALSERMLASYLWQPYEFFLTRNTSDLGNNILSEVSRVVGGILIPGVHMLSKLAVALLILALLVAVDPWLAFVVLATLGGAFALAFSFLRRKLAVIGKETAEANVRRYRTAAEAFGGIKEVKLLGREAAFMSRFAAASRRAARNDAINQTVAQVPKYVIESIAFGGILLIVIYLIGVTREIGNALPLIALYAFAGYRLMPALQQVFAGVTSIRYNLPALDALHPDGDSAPVPRHRARAQAMPFRRNVRLDEVAFTYPGSRDAVLTRLTLEVPVNRTIGLVGPTGGGKTTVVDLLAGLLTPTSGAVLVDGVALTSDTTQAWQRNVGYVPQQIYLADASIASNIAFGAPEQEIDMPAVERAARVANLHDFVRGELPQGYDTLVGERGINLSGGQRQRIGIARALYHDPKLLILDEATSALDGITESAVMDAIVNLGHSKTIVIIAHRLTTVRACDVIYLMDRGRIIEQGTYAQLSESSAQFRRMANLETN